MKIHVLTMTVWVALFALTQIEPAFAQTGTTGYPQSGPAKPAGKRAARVPTGCLPPRPDACGHCQRTATGFAWIPCWTNPF
jgi:hypothetical protein